jgi:hypothetical protein
MPIKDWFGNAATTTSKCQMRFGNALVFEQQTVRGNGRHGQRKEGVAFEDRVRSFIDDAEKKALCQERKRPNA